MWPNPQESAIWSYLLKKSLMKSLIFCAVENGAVTNGDRKNTNVFPIAGTNRKNSYYCVYCRGVLKTYQREKNFLYSDEM